MTNQPTSPPSGYTPPPGSWKEGFARRLGIYLISVAIGFMLLAIMQMAKKASTPPAPATTTTQLTAPK